MDKFASNLMNIINFLCELNPLCCQILFGEAQSFKNWLNDNGIKHQVSKYYYLILIKK
jgi:hypothetical protein